MFKKNIGEFALLLGIDPKTLPDIETPSGSKITAADRRELEAEETALTDAEFEMLKPYLPPDPSTEGTLKNRDVLSALIWAQTTGRALTHLPLRYVSSEAVRKRAERWAVAGVWDRLSDAVPTLDLWARRRLTLQAVCLAQKRRGARIRGQRTA